MIDRLYTIRIMPNNYANTNTNDVEATRRVLRELRTAARDNRDEQRVRTAALRDRVCAEYPGGPDGYRYVPEHCVPVGNNYSNKNGRGQQQQLGAAQLAAARLRTQHELLPHPPVPPEKLRGLGAVERRLVQRKLDLEQLPNFLAFAVPRVRKAVRVDGIEPDAAYEQAAGAWYSVGAREFFKNNAACRAAVFALA